jgi:chromatin modification-related protein VID21
LDQQDGTANSLLSTEKRLDTSASALEEAASQQLSTPSGLPTAVEHTRAAALDDSTLDLEPSHAAPLSPNAPPSLAQHAQPDDGATSLVKMPTSKAKPHSRISTVVFPKQPSMRKGESTELAQRTPSLDALNEEQDYLCTLFQAKAHYPPRSMNLTTLVSTAHKTLSTANHFLDYEEQMSCRTLKRIYQLQNASKWPLRQLQRSAEPQRATTHWDVLVDHAKWMSADFKEERKWRISAAKRCADWCAEYIASDEEGRSMLRIRIKRKPSKLRDPNRDSIPTPSQEIDGHDADAHPTPELIPSRDDDSASDNFDDDVHPYLDDHTTPSGIFALGSDEFTFQIDSTPAADKILDELPHYAPTGISQDTCLPAFKVHPDQAWKKDLLPVSKYATATLPSETTEPPRKRSRYNHYARNIYDDPDDFDSVPIPPDQTDVALFQPENKHIRDRIHPGHSFRPPTEYGMPSLGFYESRQSSQWTYAEDDELRRLVREYSYNWSLISSCLTPRSRFMSGADRRTPWECFERWIGLEGLPADMAKTPYFRAYSARLEAAQRNVLAAQQQAAQQLQQQQQQQGNNPAAQALMRRRTTQPVRVERKRNTRHLALLAGMRKLAQKREAQLQKQQHGASPLFSL